MSLSLPHSYLFGSIYYRRCSGRSLDNAYYTRSRGRTCIIYLCTLYKIELISWHDLFDQCNTIIIIIISWAGPCDFLFYFFFIIIIIEMICIKRWTEKKSRERGLKKKKKNNNLIIIKCQLRASLYARIICVCRIYTGWFSSAMVQLWCGQVDSECGIFAYI